MRRRGSRVGRAVLVALHVLGAVGVGTAALARPFSPRAGAAAFTIHRVDNATYGTIVPDRPFFMLFIGNDGRAGLAGQRGDALHVIGVNPGAHAATILNIPRDTYVDIPGHGRDKINAAYEYGGPQLEAETIRQLTGAPISIVIVTNFDAFQNLVNKMGGVDLNISTRIFDAFSGADFQPGIAHMNGPGALSYARDRHLDGGDITRTGHQAELLIAGLARARDATRTPFDTIRLLNLIAQNTEYQGVTMRDLWALVNFGLSLDPGAVRSVTMPASLGFVGPASVVFVGGGADSLFADFRDDALLQSH